MKETVHSGYIFDRNRFLGSAELRVQADGDFVLYVNEELCDGLDDLEDMIDYCRGTIYTKMVRDEVGIHLLNPVDVRSLLNS